MSVEAMTWAFTVDLPPCPKSVLVALANRADEDGYCWPGIGDLERRTGWKTRAIQNALRLLVGQNMISISPRFKESARQDSNLYQLNVGACPPPTSCGEGAPHAPIGVHQVRGEGASHAPIWVHQVRGEGAPHAPKSSSEQSEEQSIEQRAVGTTVPAVGKQAAVVVMTLFDEFWQIYPDRNGKKLEKEATRRLFLKLSDGDKLLAITAARHYAASLSQQGISAKDPKRFLWDGHGQEPWRDWIEPAKPPTAQTAPPQARCIWANGGGCEAYAAHPSRYCPDHRDKLRAIQGEINRVPHAAPIVGLHPENAGSGL